MNTKHSEEVIKGIVEQYSNGKAVALLCAEYRVPRSTVYFWIKQHRKLKSSSNAEISYWDYYSLKRKHNKLKEKLEIIKAAGCSLSAPLKEKLYALETLYGQFSVHALCRIV
ncbi:MAG: transposase [Peptococcaceae bacterium]|nr:transposase [Peptococcaceae bacterium]